MRKILKTIKNLFKVYDILTGKSVIINLDQLKTTKGKWYYVCFIARRTDEISVDELSIFQFKTKKRAKTTDKKLRKYYKLN